MTTKEELYAIWSIEEMLLQSYRAIFVTMQSILIAAFASFPAQSLAAKMVIVGFGLINIPAWMYVTERRQFYLDTVQFLLKCHDGKLLPEASSGHALFRQSQATGKLALVGSLKETPIAEHPLFKKNRLGSARLVVGLLTPLFFFFVWIALVLTT